MLFCFGLPELLLWLLWTPPTADLTNVGQREFVPWLSDVTVEDKTDQLYQEDRELLWKFIPGVEIDSINHHRNPDGQRQPIHISINDDGYRGTKTTPAADASRILCLGDSNMFGYPLDDEHAFPNALHKALVPSGRKFEVVNAGVSGYSIAQGQRWYREQFQEEQFDILILSFLNNDAMRQPQTDFDLFQRKMSLVSQASDFARHSRLIQLADALVATKPSIDDMPARVPLEDFERLYRWFFNECAQRNMYLIVLDFRAYDPYESYSRVLQSLLRTTTYDYLAVKSTIEDEFNDLKMLELYPELADQVQRRWSDAVLKDEPYLWYYAEFEHPEHLNEVGTAWLADKVASKITNPSK